MASIKQVQYKSDTYVKQQAFQLEECITTINKLYITN
jgi:hypothetical protein